MAKSITHVHPRWDGTFGEDYAYAAVRADYRLVIIVESWWSHRDVFTVSFVASNGPDDTTEGTIDVWPVEPGEYGFAHGAALGFPGLYGEW